MPSRSRECQRCGRNRQERYYSGPRARYCADCLRKARARAAKDRRLRETYGITIEEFERLLEAQRGPDGQVRCLGCNETRSQNYKWSVDHDHRIEALEGVRASIRGLLCRRCNKVLRDIRDSITVLVHLTEYLRLARQATQAVLARN